MRRRSPSPRRLHGMPIIFNLPAFLIVMVITWVLVRGISESAWLNSAMVVLKLVIIALLHLRRRVLRQTRELARRSRPTDGRAVSSAAAIIFFAYIGFDAVSTAAEETRNPQRDMPIGMIASLVICTLIYIAVAIVLTGLMPYQQLGTAEPLATAFSALGMNWTAGDHLARRGVCDHLRARRVSARAAAHLLLDGARRAAAAMGRARPSEVPHAAHHHHPDRRGRRRLRRGRQHQRSRRADQHRHAVRLRAGGDWRDCPAPHGADHPRPFRTPWVPGCRSWRS